MNQEELESKLLNKVIFFAKDWGSFKTGELAFCTAAIINHGGKKESLIVFWCNNETFEEFKVDDNYLKELLDNTVCLLDLGKYLTQMSEVFRDIGKLYGNQNVKT